MLRLACALALIAACHRDRTLVVVSSEDSGEIRIIDPARDEVVQTIAVGKRPRGMRASPDGRLVYVALSGSAKGGHERDEHADGIGVVDLDRGTLVRVIESGRDPEAFDLTPDGRQMYVSNEETAEISVVDVASGRVLRKIPVGAEPEGVTMAADGKAVYVTSESDSAVDVIKEDRVVTRIPKAKRPRAVVMSGPLALVSAELGGAVQMVDTRRHATIAEVPTGGKPMGIAVDGDLAYVSNGREGSVAVIDLASHRVAKRIEHVGTRVWGIGIAKKKLYAAAGPDVAVIDLASGTVTKRLPAGSGPWGVLVVPRSR